jgi:ABC-2 type transport system permease protein
MWELIARKDFDDAIRERQLHVGVGLFVVVGLFAGWLYGDSNHAATATDPGLALVGILTAASLFLVPITGLMLAQGRIVDKRSRGELVVLLGMPFSRRDVVTGSLASRIAITAIVVLSLFATATGIAALLVAPLPLLRLLGVLVVFVVFAAIFVAVGIGISAGASGTTRAAIIAVGFYLFWLFRLHDIVWGFLLSIAYFRRPPAGLRALVAQFGPFSALRNVVAGIYPPLTDAFAYFGGQPPTGVTLAAEPAIGVLVLAFWATVPLYVGLHRFEEADL